MMHKAKKVILSVIVLIVIVDGHVDILYDESVQADVRPLPDDLLQMMNTKTEYDIMMEECMNEFIQCSAYKLREVIVCAYNTEGEFKVFQNMCEMFYANCKANQNYWHYMDDKLCHAVEGNK
ncbi:hypothetical protein evm_006286 [Chilo suppressalis]|nr:hypothetical protein evm_006286 [Chilo suppressalis]